MRSLRACAGGWVALLLAASAAAEPIRVIDQAASDLVYDPATKRIYASVPSAGRYFGRGIIGLDPDTGQIGSTIGVDGAPGKLAIAGQGRYLYAALDGGASVVRIDTVSPAVGLRFSTDTGSGANAVDDMAVVPGHPEAVAVSLARVTQRGLELPLRSGAGVFVYDNGQPRLDSAPGGGSLAFLDGTNRLYGYDNDGPGGFRRMTVDTAGITVEDATAGLISGAGVEIRYDQGLLVTTTGRVIDPEARALLGTFAGLVGHHYEGDG